MVSPFAPPFFLGGGGGVLWFSNLAKFLYSYMYNQS